MAIYESGEDYLETIYILNRKKQGVHAVDIANELGFSKPSVTRAMKILREAHLITVDEFNHIVLTEEGQARAEAIYEKHNAIARFLMHIGVSEETAFKDACRMEHVLSEETFACFKNYHEKVKQ